MGQYQEWLHYQELDRQLRGRLQSLETVLKQVQAQIPDLKKQLPGTNNPIILALIEQLVRQIATQHSSSQRPQSPNKPGTMDAALISAAPATTTHAGSDPLSSALSAWGGLPDFDPLTTPVNDLSRTPGTSGNQQPSAASQPVIAPRFSLPLDSSRFPAFTHDTHAQTQSEPFAHNQDTNSSDSSPSLEIPDWLQQISILTDQGFMPIDPESVRTNRLVQRWLTRWGKQSPPTPAVQPSEEETHE